MRLKYPNILPRSFYFLSLHTGSHQGILVRNLSKILYFCYTVLIVLTYRNGYHYLHIFCNLTFSNLFLTCSQADACTLDLTSDSSTLCKISSFIDISPRWSAFRLLPDFHNKKCCNTIPMYSLST